MPLATIHAFLDHGRAELTIEKDLEQAERILKTLPSAGINLEQVTNKLLADGVKAFFDSYDKLLAGIDQKKSVLRKNRQPSLKTALGKYEADVNATLEKTVKANMVARIWQKDHTVWKPDPAEITNRLGWLNITDLMREQAADLKSLADDVRNAGFRHVVLLGMGGSSLGPEVLRQVFGPIRGFPHLIVLDSTVPAAVQAVAKATDPEKTLFLVSSKSGTTSEPLALFRYFYSLVERAAGKGKAGGNFVAITDAGTPLAKMGERENFRKVFVNPADIGGRYSVLSYFGLVPAALTGIDVTTLLDRADTAREGCASCILPQENPGSWLGACMAAMALRGRNKLTLVTSPRVSSFGLWVEQLVAESTGKEGKGIIPVTGEPLLEPRYYGDDRLFVYLRLEGDDNTATDNAIDAIRTAGQPVVMLDMRDTYDIGAEFFRWEFATAVAGAVLDINPFDQPDVQKSKDVTEKLLREYRETGRLPPLEPSGLLKALLTQPAPGSYLAIMAYLHQTQDIDRAFVNLRRKIAEKHRITTTLGYGPRFLHSTGQLHKGGPAGGLFLQITAGHGHDIAIPGEPFTFGALSDAQAQGDFRALQALGRKVVRVHLPQGGTESIERLADEIA
jgi:glucose-6-phosphate isomerase